MSDTKLTDIDFKLEWKSPVASHIDVLCLNNIDLNKDQLPSDFSEKLLELTVGDSYSETLAAKEMLSAGFSTDQVITFESKYFDTNFKGQYSPPIQYRFYPSAIAWQGLDTDNTDYSPFRLISIREDKLVADRNHPLAKYYLTLTATKVSEREVSLSKDQSQRNLGKLLTGKGPGMQAPFEFGEPVFFKDYPYQLQKQSTDKKIDVIHQESGASVLLAKIYTELLPKHSKVLDLMSDSNSYLESDYKTGLLVGLGSNEDDLSRNKRLDTYSVQDLNNDTQLPFETDSFDDAICSFSIDHLTDPLAVMQEIARVVISGGKFIVTFSGQSSAESSITLWPQLHPFERMQLVLEYFRQNLLFKELNTFSKRGMHKIGGKNIPSQVYAVWGIIK